MADGKIQEAGTFQQLIKNKADFAKLLMDQLVDEEEEGDEGKLIKATEYIAMDFESRYKTTFISLFKKAEPSPRD